MPKTAVLPCVLLVLLVATASAFGQASLSDVQRGIMAAEQDANARSAAAAARRQYNAQRRLMQAQQKAREDAQEARVAQLTPDQLKGWQKKSGIYGQFYKYEIKRNNAIMGVAIYHPKYGYAVDDKFQSDGDAWLTLDAAMHARFQKHELATLGDIPGWANSDKMTQEEQMAELRSKTADQAKPLAIKRIAKNVANDIVEGAGPTIQNQIAGELGVKATPPKKLIKFRRINDDSEGAMYANSGNTFIISQLKKGDAYELVRQKDGKPIKKYDEVFTTLKEAIEFASEQP